MNLSHIIPLILVVGSLRAGAQPITIQYFDDSVSAVGATAGLQLITNSALSNDLNSGQGVGIVSPDDGSASFVAAVSTYTAGTAPALTGSGSIRLTPGELDGKPSQGAGGQSSTYTLVKVNAPMRYSFSASCEDSGALISAVTFDGSGITGNEAMLVRGTFTTGSTFSIIAECNNSTNIGGAASWRYQLSLTPAPAASQFSTSQQGAFSQSSQNTESAGEQALAQALASSAGGGFASSFFNACMAELASAHCFLDQALDPLDTNYTVVAQVALPSLTPLSVTSNITQAEAGAFNSWLTNLAWTAAYASAWSASADRAEGAAYARNAAWSSTQTGLTAQFGAQLASYLDQEPGLRSNVVARFQVGGFGVLTVTGSQVTSFQNQIASNGLPATVRAGLSSLGIDGAGITNILGGFLAASQSTLATNFPQSLINTNQDAAQHATAAALRDASLMLINAAALAGGKSRFDLPTEPGYTYTIQFTSKLSDHASWTTLLSTNASTALLSFTNTAGAGATAGYYRATHN
jgi:hypothetical protein